MCECVSVECVCIGIVCVHEREGRGREREREREGGEREKLPWTKEFPMDVKYLIALFIIRSVGCDSLILL